MALNPQQLADGVTEVTTDPLGLGYASGMSVADGRALFNTVLQQPGAATPGEVIQYLADSGKLGDLDESQTDANLTRLQRKAARHLISSLRMGARIDMDQTVVLAVLDILVGAGVFGTAHKAAIVALGATTSTRARTLGLPSPIRESDVAAIFTEAGWPV